MEKIEHAIYRKEHRNWADLTFRTQKIRKEIVGTYNMEYMGCNEI